MATAKAIVAIEEVKPAMEFDIHGRKYLRVNAKRSRSLLTFHKDCDGYCLSIDDGVVVELPLGTLVQVDLDVVDADDADNAEQTKPTNTTPAGDPQSEQNQSTASMDYSNSVGVPRWNMFTE
jgi:hypothetical protein